MGAVHCRKRAVFIDALQRATYYALPSVGTRNLRRFHLCGMNMVSGDALATCIHHGKVHIIEGIADSIHFI